VNALQRGLHKVDDLQQSRRPVAFVFGVVKKFGDDRCGSLAALLTYYGFLSIFPLLLLLITVVGLATGGSVSATHRVETSALSQFPVVGQQLGSNIHELHQRSGVGLAIGIVGLIWGSQGAIQSGQYAMAEVWNVPNVDRPNYVSKLLRTLAMMGVLGVFLLASTALAGVATVGNRPALQVFGAVVLSLLLNMGIYLAAFRLLTPKQINWRPLVPGALLGGVGWTFLQYIGGALVEHSLRNSSQVYGFFAVVLGLLAWIFLGAQLTLYAAEVNVVRARHLWPRSMVQPPLTPADEQVLTDVVVESRSRPEQSLEVGFEAGEGEPMRKVAPSVGDPAVGEEKPSSPTGASRG
jgi:YihY family inner membrane protein